MKKISAHTLLAAATAALFLWMLCAQPYSFRYATDHRNTVIEELVTSWQVNSEWQHCMLVAPVVAWILFGSRAWWLRAPVAPSDLGWVWIAAALFAYWFGYRTDIQYGAYVWAQCFIMGAALVLRGREFARRTLFPWLFLAFVWPLPFLDNMIAFPLRVIMSSSAHHLLNFVGVENIQVGTALVSAPVFGPDNSTLVAQGARFALDVADPCSGIRSLFALVMLSALYGYYSFLQPAHETLLKDDPATAPNLEKKAWACLAVTVASSVPLAVCGNLMRMFLLTFGTIWFGSSTAIGTIESPSFYHTAAGYAVFAVALGGLYAVVTILQFDWSVRAPDRPPTAPADAARTPQTNARPAHEDRY